MNAHFKTSIQPTNQDNFFNNKDGPRFSQMPGDFGMDIRPSVMTQFDKMAGQMGQELDENER